MPKPDHDTIMGLIRQHFGPKLLKAVTFERWKDGIEIDYPIAAIELFFEGAAAIERERIAAALEAEGENSPCAEDGSVYRSAAWLVRADFSYEEADRLQTAAEQSVQPVT